MELSLASDHNGWELKNQLVSWLSEQGFTVKDLGPQDLDPQDDYPDYAWPVAEWVAADEKNRRGILVCGTGIGMNIAANKVKGIRAAMIYDPEIAQTAQRDDDVNILTLGAKHITPDQAKTVVQAWLKTPFSAAERHQRRVQKVHTYEEKNL